MALDLSDVAILDLLTRRVRLATGQHLADLSGKPTGANRLCRLGLLQKTSMIVAVPTLAQPLATWSPGQPRPQFGQLSWQLLKRRKQTISRRLPVFWATVRAVRMVGGVGGRIRQPVQVEHDLGTAAAFICRRRLYPEEALQWIGEDVYRTQCHAKGKIPDALICSTNGGLERAIEYGGAYSAERLRRFHAYCSTYLVQGIRGLAWELW